MLENVRNPAFSEILTYVCNLPCFSTNAALEIFALDLSSSDTAMPLRGTVASEQRWAHTQFKVQELWTSSCFVPSLMPWFFCLILQTFMFIRHQRLENSQANTQNVLAKFWCPGLFYTLMQRMVSCYFTLFPATTFLLKLPCFKMNQFGSCHSSCGLELEAKCS